MADLGNLFFTLGISTKDFDKKMEDEIKKAQQLKKELQEALKGTSLGADKSSAEAMKLMAEANKLNAEANKIAAQTERSKKKAIDDGTTSQKKQNDETSKTSDLYQKLYNKILLINEEQSKLSTNAKFGFDSAQVQDAIQKLETFKSLLKDALASGSKADMQAAMKLYSNQDYAVFHPGLQDMPQDVHVGILDVAAILAQMQGDGIRPGVFRHQRRLDRAGILGAARLAQGGHVVDVDAESDHSFCRSMRSCRVARGLSPR
jgi:hypothetical protein